jgi:hypothetical protein
VLNSRNPRILVGKRTLLSEDGNKLSGAMVAG